MLLQNVSNFQKMRFNDRKRNKKRWLESLLSKKVVAIIIIIKNMMTSTVISKLETSLWQSNHGLVQLKNQISNP